LPLLLPLLLPLALAVSVTPGVAVVVAGGVVSASNESPVIGVCGA
jgi:hypothetical protein